MNKDKALGFTILAICVVLALGYVVSLFYPQWLVNVGLIGSTVDVQFWLIAVPVFVVAVAVLLIGAWIGFTMATTPPPKAIEEITSEPDTQSSSPQTKIS